MNLAIIIPILWAVFGLLGFVITAGLGLAFGSRPADRWVFSKLLALCLLCGPLLPVVSILASGMMREEPEAEPGNCWLIVHGQKTHILGPKTAFHAHSEANAIMTWEGSRVAVFTYERGGRAQ